jgi:arylsulfatase A-like enzyme
MKTLVIEARGLPAGFLGCYGNEWIGTPCIDRLASEGVVFDSHIAAVPDIGATVPTCTLERLESLAYARIDAVTGFAAAALAAWRRLPDGGVLWIDGPNLAPPWSLPRDLLDSYCEPPEESWPDPPRGVWPQIDIADLLRLHNTFGAVVTYFDAQLDALLEDMNADDDALICITARCGLPLGEHGLVATGRAWLHEELVHVPLVMRFPGRRDAGRHIAALTQPADLPSAFAQLTAGHTPTPTVGRGLLRLVNDEAETIRPHALSALTVGDSAELALRTPDWALLVPTQIPAGDPPRGPQLYVKPDDRWEVNDVRQQHLELAEELEATLTQTHR